MHSLNAKISIVKEARFSSILPIDRTLIRCYYSGPEWTWERWQWRGIPHSPKLQHCWNLTIRLFSVISRTLVWGWVLPLCRKAVGVFYSPSRLGKLFCWVLSILSLIWLVLMALFCAAFRRDSVSLLNSLFLATSRFFRLRCCLLVV